MRKPAPNLQDLCSWAAEAGAAIEANKIINRSTTIQACQLPNGVLLETRLSRQSTSSKVELMLVKSVKRDYLECVGATIEDDGTITEGENEVQIAKPYELQGYPFEGETIDGVEYAYDVGNTGGNVNPRTNPCQRRTYKRVADSDKAITAVSGIETFSANAIFYQELYPAYEPDKTLILVAECSSPVVNLPDESFELQGITISNPPLSLTKVDLNFGGRHFRDLDFEIPVCVDVGNGQVLKRKVRCRGAPP